MTRFLFLLPILFVLLGCSSNNHLVADHQIISDTVRIKKDMDSIVKTGNYRNYKNLQALDSAAAYIKRRFLLVSDSVEEQKYTFRNDRYKNIICSVNTEKPERIIVGAHYDVCGNQDGADDNASGVVGLIDLARLLKNEKLNYRIDFVAFTLEEPPFFRSDFMGSHVHAKYLHDNNVAVKGMICLEMIGYFTDQPNSQDYPLGFLSWFYGKKGNYITVAQKYGNGKFGNEVRRLMQKSRLLPTRSFKGPAFLPGVDFSDHLNYWKYGYSAVMITNTSFYRNKNYHQPTDKIETLDFKRLALTVDELYLALKQLK
jgi:hypothetical protein